MKALKKTKLQFSLIFIAVLFSTTASFSIEPKSSEESNFKKAVRYFYQKKLEMAELMLQEELKINPENELAYSYLGDIFFKKKRYDGALKLYTKALDLNPANAEDYFRIGQIYYYKKQGNKSIENFERSYSLNPKLKFAYYHIGLTYLMLLRDKENTIKGWENFLRIAPEDPQYEKIRRVIELLKDPNFVIPPVGSDVSIEEALLLGGIVLDDVKRKAGDKKAGHEAKKTKQKLEGIYEDDDL